MKSSLSSDKISYEEFQLHTRLYDQYLPPKIRLEEVPEVLEARRASGDVFLEKTEVQALMEWKLWLSA